MLANIITYNYIIYNRLDVFCCENTPSIVVVIYDNKPFIISSTNTVYYTLIVTSIYTYACTYRVHTTYIYILNTHKHYNLLLYKHRLVSIILCIVAIEINVWQRVTIIKVLSRQIMLLPTKCMLDLL